LLDSIEDRIELDEDTAYSAAILAVDDSDLYMLINWIKPTSFLLDGVLLRLSLASGKVTRLRAIPGGGKGLAIVGDQLVFSQGARTTDGTGAIMRLARSGGEPVMLAETVGLQAAPVVADDANAYFVDEEGTKRAPIEGGDVKRLSTLVPFSLGLSDGALLMASFGGGTIVAVSRDGGDETVLAEGQGGPLYPIACGEDVCWVNANRIGESALMRRSPDGRITVVGAGFSQPHALVFDGTSFFVTAGAGGHSLVRIPAEGGDSIFAYGEAGLSHLALNDDCLFWSSASTVTAVSRAAADVAGLER
jgi:hypothetical protein